MREKMATREHRGRGFYLSQAFEKATETWLSWAQKKAFSNQRKQ